MSAIPRVEDLWRQRLAYPKQPKPVEVAVVQPTIATDKVDLLRWADEGGQTPNMAQHPNGESEFEAINI